MFILKQVSINTKTTLSGLKITTLISYIIDNQLFTHENNQTSNSTYRTSHIYCLSIIAATLNKNLHLIDKAHTFVEPTLKKP